MTTTAATADDETIRMFKRTKIETLAPSTKVIGTHSGTFQADEAMGCWLLHQLPEYRGSKIVRSRDTIVLDPLDIVLDVGGIYNHEMKRYDHHQRDYNEKFDDTRCTKLSASGLIYRHYGKEVLHEYYPYLSQRYIDLAYIKIYDTLLEALDAIDTGVELVPEGVKVLYKDSTGLSARVSRLNPRWNEDIDEVTGLPPNYDERFEKAMEICGIDFTSVMINVIESYLPARSYVEEAIQKRYETSPDGQIICFPTGGLPWQSHLYELEKEFTLTEPTQLIKFVLYTDQGGMWRVQAVTVEGAKFTNRISLPERWRGVRDSDLATVSGIPGARFVHAAGFIGGNDTYEGALQMAQIAIQEYYDQQQQK